MTGILVRKLLRDIRLPLAIVAVLLAAYQCLWAKITERISSQLMPMLLWLAAGRGVTGQEVEKTIFAGPGQIMRTMMGGENVSIFRVGDMLTIGLVHPLTITILCVWAIGRAAGAIAGEIDRGTMELLLAQPLARFRVILAHLILDVLTIPVLCLSLWGGHWLGVRLFGLHEVGNPIGVAGEPINPAVIGPAMWNAATLLFAVSGITMWLSARGRYRWRVLGTAVLLMLLQFLVNVVGQLWDTVAWMRPFTVFYYYRPQEIILQQQWSVDLGAVWNGGEPLYRLNVLAVLVAVGTIGYGLALGSFSRRDLPAPL